MNFRMNEQALTEVIGFVLILGIVTAALSLYMIYSVPAQGRENEILHMNTVKDEFSLYKFSLDALWSNNQVTNAVTSTFDLGPAASHTLQGNSIIPIMSPIDSAAVFSLNLRDENLTVTSQSLITDPVNITISSTAIPGSLNLASAPGKLLINISDVGNLETGYGIQVNGTGWAAFVNKTPRFTYYLDPSWSTIDLGTATLIRNLSFTPSYQYAGTDITVTVLKNGVPTVQNLVVYSNVTALSAGQNYSVNLMDDAYGIRSFVSYPTQVTFSTPGSGNDLAAMGIAVYDYSEQLASHTVALGSVEYQSQNNYWIQQKYYYQMGGVFLEQDDGTTYKLAPALTMSYNSTSQVVTITINEIAFDTSNQGSIGGKSSVQIKTRLIAITDLPYATVTGNSKSVVISITSDDSRVPNAWYEFFEEGANRTGGVPREYYSLSKTSNSAQITINGIDATDQQYDVEVSVKRIDYYVWFHGVGGIVE